MKPCTEQHIYYIDIINRVLGSITSLLPYCHECHSTRLIIYDTLMLVVYQTYIHWQVHCITCSQHMIATYIYWKYYIVIDTKTCLSGLHKEIPRSLYKLLRVLQVRPLEYYRLLSLWQNNIAFTTGHKTGLMESWPVTDKQTIVT